ncbi:MAG: major capsid protein [Microviridae sp.]|nr:MAG: major capsid protein [Microviridae sp.]
MASNTKTQNRNNTMSRRPSNSNHTFSEVPAVQIPRSSFNRSHSYKTTFDSGYLYPIMVDEALPGDTFKCNLTAFARMATPIYPVMDNLFMDVFYFSCPNRLLWDNWEKFCGEQIDPGDSIDYTIPKCAPGGAVVEGSISDYMGVPIQGSTVSILDSLSSLPFRMYNRVYNEWFRDQNLQDSLDQITTDGPDASSFGDFNTKYALRKRGKRHDYFTSALPWPQKGDSVDLPLGTTAPLFADGTTPTFDVNNQINTVLRVDPLSDQVSIPTAVGGSGSFQLEWNNSGLAADLSAATAATINQLRQAFQVQKLLERDARGGTRYVEIIKSHFGVTTPSAGWRSEYLGGGTKMVNISPIAQTSSTDTTSPQGNLSAMGTATLDQIGFTKSFTEHSTILCLINVRADLTYQQGLNRMWSRDTRYDFYWPALANIGEQSVLNKEIYFTGLGTDDNTFGYQERYAEYRYKPSLVTGQFRSNAATTLDAWHLSQDFASLPALNASFIEDSPPVDRVIAVPSEPEFLFDGYFSMNGVRPMPLDGVPGMVDHF